ncbi:hypothetical protein CO725_01020 [Vibrio parahaemolyticus]|uniref:hypothetical protein n=1 Tax=Vibrio parahaemolyticus TaxID=670 RepID=UPI000BE334B1|nr:hypothetical protein [Vibrio parahaemolyticus]ATI44268.1 hypothetical protein CO725_01020 [Vibrio parahaemolyticus]
MKFDIFKTKYQTVLGDKKTVKILKQMFGCIPSFNQFIVEDSQLANQLDDTLGINTNAEELFFENNRKLVFVNKSIVEMLNRAKFTSNINATITPPNGFETFALCFEKDTYVNVAGQSIKLYPCQITVMSEEDMFEKVHKPFGELTGMNIQRNPDINISITVSYKIKDVTYRSCVDISEIITKLDDGVRESGELSNIIDQRLNDVEQLTTNKLMKIAVQLLIFNSATGNQYLVKGFPHQAKFRMPVGTTRNYWNASHFAYESSSKVSEHIRSSHFRNLQNEKYYKGEYESVEKGSRWVLVKESFVGKSKTFTQTDTLD